MSAATRLGYGSSQVTEPVDATTEVEVWIVVKEHAWKHEDGKRPTLAYLLPCEFGRTTYPSFEAASAFIKAGNWPLGWVAMKLDVAALPRTSELSSKLAKYVADVRKRSLAYVRLTVDEAEDLIAALPRSEVVGEQANAGARKPDGWLATYANGVIEVVQDAGELDPDWEETRGAVMLRALYASVPAQPAPELIGAYAAGRAAVLQQIEDNTKPHPADGFFPPVLAAPPAVDPWRMAVDEALVINCLDCTSDAESPVAAVARLVSFEVKIALDPVVSREAQALIDRGAAVPRADVAPADRAHTSDWVNCPVCGEPDMNMKTYPPEGDVLIFCINHACRSNGGKSDRLAVDVAPVVVPAEIETSLWTLEQHQLLHFGKRHSTVAEIRKLRAALAAGAGPVVGVCARCMGTEFVTVCEERGGVDFDVEVPCPACHPEPLSGQPGGAQPEPKSFADLYERNAEGIAEQTRQLLVGVEQVAVLPVPSAADQALGLYAVQADEIRDLLDKHAPTTVGGIKMRIEQVLLVLTILAMTSKAAQDVFAERQRQITVEGWTPEHDDKAWNGQFSRAASAYARHAGYSLQTGKWMGGQPQEWPWAPKWWKPGEPRRNLVKAGALILAEIERLDRAATQKGAVK